MVEAASEVASVTYSVTFEVFCEATEQMLSTELECVIVPSTTGLRLWCDEEDQAIVDIAFADFTVMALQNKALPQDQMLYAVSEKTENLATFLSTIGLTDIH